MNDKNNCLTDEDLVQVLYESILGRKPDINGLKHHISSIFNMARKDALALLIFRFMNSEEFKTKNIRTVPLQSIINSKSINRKVTINHIIGLGTHCYTSQLLKNASLKKYSCPFDWIFSSPSMVADILNDDFAIFLDSSYYNPTPIHLRKLSPKLNCVNHEFYRKEYGIEYMFNHHEVHLKEHHDYFFRAVERFRSVLASDDTVRFVVCTKHTSNALIEFNKLAKTILNKRPRGVSLSYFSIEVGNSILPKLEVLDNSIEGFNLYHFKSMSRWGALSFENFIDDVALLKILTDDINFEFKKI